MKFVFDDNGEVFIRDSSYIEEREHLTNDGISDNDIIELSDFLKLKSPCIKVGECVYNLVLEGVDFQLHAQNRQRGTLVATYNVHFDSEKTASFAANQSECCSDCRCNDGCVRP